MAGNLTLFHAVWFPFAAAFLCYLSGRFNKKVRDRLVQLSVVAEMGLLIWAVMTFLQAGESLTFTLEGFCMQGLHLKLDSFRALYGSIAALMWMMTGIFSREYFAHYRNRNRYYLFFLLTLGATIGVFLSADLYTTFIFFEIMSLTSYVWVIHDEKPAAMKAGEIYLAIAIIGGLVMLMGLFLLQDAVGTLRMDELHGAVQAVWAEKSARIYTAGGCLLFGFGAKAGMFPLHIWLPKAHPVAPAPASALLSGILTKTGIFGVLVVCSEIFRHDAQWGMLILGLGTVTMFGGAFLAVFSIDLKRTLACSSMSQIGFILVGAGMLELLGEHNSLAAYGSILHMVNHSMIKLVLFMAAGVVYMNLHELNLNDIRGFGRRKPFLKGVFLVGTLSICGIPGFSGYLSKTLLHESIVEYAVELAAHGEPTLWIRTIEWIFLITGGMTIAYMTKIFVAVFVEEHPTKQEEFDAKGHNMYAGSIFALLIPALMLLVLGVIPNLAMRLVGGAAQGFLHAHAPEHAIHFFSFTNLKGAIISLTIGMLVYFGFIRKFLIGKDDYQEKVYINAWPGWMDLEDLIYRPVLEKAVITIVAGLCKLLDQMYVTRWLLKMILNVSAFFSRGCDHLLDSILLFFRRTTHRSKTDKHVYLIGSRLSRTFGTILDNCAGVLNRTVFRKHPYKRSFVVTFAEWEEVMHKTNRLITASLSFGLMLAAIGLALTLIYLLWW